MPADAATTTTATTTATSSAALAATPATVATQAVNDGVAVTQGTAPAAGNPIPWLEGATPEQVGYIQNKGWTDPKQVLEGYQNLERMRGVPADRLLTLPAADADDAAKAAFYEKLGRPKEATGYDFSLGDKDNGWGDTLKQSFHKHGIPAEAARGIIADYAAKVVADEKAAQTARVESVQADQGKLKTEWGAAFDQHMDAARKGRDLLGWNAETVDAVAGVLGHANMVKMLHSVAERSGEAKFHTGDGGPQGFGNKMTPEQAKAKLNELRTNPEWVKRHNAGGAAELAEKRRLLAFANPEG